MNKFFQQIWKDPVWSKIISAIFLSAGAIVWSQLKKPLLSNSIWNGLLFFFSYSIPVNLSLLIGIIFVLSLFIFNRKSKKQYDSSSRVAVTKNIKPSVLLDQLPSKYYIRRQRYGEVEVISEVEGG